MSVVFVVRCKSCGDVVGAYDLDRSDTADMGTAIRWAAKHQGTIAFEASPVEVVLCGCGGPPILPVETPHNPPGHAGGIDD